MRILLTGATGYIGKRLLPVLVEQGHTVICLVRDKNRFTPAKSLEDAIEVIEGDLLKPETLQSLPKNIDAAYYLVHSMSASKNFVDLEKESAVNFREALSDRKVTHVIYLSGIINEDNLSEHLASRKNVEIELKKGSYNFTTLRAGIIIGSGSASFEIIRDLAEKLPIMITPKWLNTRCQPIGVSDVIAFLSKTLCNRDTFNQSYDIGGPDVLTYKEMLLGYSRARNLKRTIFTVPVMTPRLSSYWLYFVTSTSYKLAVSLVDSMKVEVVCSSNNLSNMLDIVPLTYEEALGRAFTKIENNEIVSSWKDAHVSSDIRINISDFINVPTYGCFRDQRSVLASNRMETINRIWSIGGKQGWYYGNWLWRIRGILDKLVGGVGLRRGRTNQDSLSAGDALDFWRVLYANKNEGRLLLLAEMKLPGEAWLEFSLHDDQLIQTATFRPLGLMGRLYWFSVYPFHGFIFHGMINALASNHTQPNVS
ncbi:MAG: SDR family oxidoreductase [Salibacteraceae bacterium]